jgi:tetratricopeptide (TPR) repeat protein
MRSIILLVIGGVLLAPPQAHAELRGVELYERGDYGRAKKALEEALRSKSLSAADRAKARLYLAAALHASGAEESASIQLEELVRAAPALKVDPVLFPPKFVALADRARERVEAERQAQANADPQSRPSQDMQAFLLSIKRLYEDLEYEQALEQISRARSFVKVVEEDVTLSLYQAIILADMNRWEESTAVFKRALFLRPESTLPVKVSPKVAQHFATVSKQVRAELAARPPGPPPTLSSPQPSGSPPAQQPGAQVTEAPPQDPAPGAPSGSKRLRPEVFGFLDPVGRSYGLGGGLSFGLGSLELSARVLMGEELAVGAEAGVLLGSGRVRPRFALRGTAIPGLSGYGGGAVAGVRLTPVQRLTFLVDVGAEYLKVPQAYRGFAVTSSVGLGFELF